MKVTFLAAAAAAVIAIGAQAAPAKEKMRKPASAKAETMNCEVAGGEVTEEYGVILTPFEKSGSEGTIVVSFGGYRIGRAFAGTFVGYPNEKAFRFAAVADGDPDQMMVGSVEGLLGKGKAKSIQVTKAPNWVSKQGAVIPCK